MTQQRSTYEEIRVSGDELVARVRELIRDGNASRLYLKNDEGETLLEIPLTAGVVVAAAGVAFAPVLVAVGAVAAIWTHVTIGVDRTPPTRRDRPHRPAAISGSPRVVGCAQGSRSIGGAAKQLSLGVTPRDRAPSSSASSATGFR